VISAVTTSQNYNNRPEITNNIQKKQSRHITSSRIAVERWSFGHARLRGDGVRSKSKCYKSFVFS